mgnify:FL=1
MSTQSEREAAARAWWKSPGHDTAQALADATRTAYGYACPVDGTRGTLLGALSLWMKWCREDAAKAAPAREADALEGVVWRDPRAVIAWAEQDWSDRPTRKPNGFEAMGVSDADARVANEVRGGMGWTLAITSAIAAHARAQLAREAHEAAPTQPEALTLDEIREAAKARGYLVVHESGWERPDVVLAFLTAYAAMTEGDANRWLDERPSSQAVIAILGALGVTPAVLS